LVSKKIKSKRFIFGKHSANKRQALENEGSFHEILRTGVLDASKPILVEEAATEQSKSVQISSDENISDLDQISSMNFENPKDDSTMSSRTVSQKLKKSSSTLKQLKVQLKTRSIVIFSENY